MSTRAHHIAPPIPAHRPNNLFSDPTIGQIDTARFIQPANGAVRTVQIVRYQGSETWKARILETATVVTRFGSQREFVSPAAARMELTRWFRAIGLEMGARGWVSNWAPPAPTTGAHAQGSRI